LSQIKENIKTNSEIIENLTTEMQTFKEPLTQAKNEAEHLKKSVASFDKDKMGLTNAKGCLKDLREKNSKIEDARKELDKKFKRVENEKESMYVKFEIAIAQLRGRAEYKNEKLEEKLHVFEDELEKKELNFRELAQRCGLGQD